MSAREARRILYAGIAAMLLTPTATASDAGDVNNPTFEAPSSEESAGHRLAVSDDKKALTLDFGGAGLTAILDARPDFPTVIARTFLVALPVSEVETGSKIAVFVQGYLGAETGVDASLLTVVNGQAYPMDFASLVPAQDGLLKNKECDPLKEFLPEKRSREEKPGGTDNPFLQCLEVDSSSVHSLRLALFLLLKQHEKHHGGELDVTVVDAMLRSGDAPPNAPSKE